MDVVNNTWVSAVQWKGFGSYSYQNGSFCFDFPSHVSSFGIWEKLSFRDEGLGTWEYPLPHTELAVIVVFIAWQAVHMLFKKLGVTMPKFTSQMLAGVLLGIIIHLDKDSALGKIFFPIDYHPEIIETFGAFGFAMYWFIKGVKMDVKMISRTGRKATITGTTTVCLPFLVAALITRSKLRTGGQSLAPGEYVVMAYFQSITVFTGIAKLLRDLKLSHSQLGRIALSSAIVGDFVTLTIYFVWSWTWMKSKSVAIYAIKGVIAYILVAIFVFRPAMFWVVRRTPKGQPIKDIYVNFILILAFATAVYWTHFEQFAPFGLFIFGLVIPSGPPLGSTLVQWVETFNFGLILPVFVCLSMMQLDIQLLLKGVLELTQLKGFMLEPAIFIATIYVVKFVAAAISPYTFGMPFKDSIVLGFILGHKGIIELSCYKFFVEQQVFSSKNFSVIILFILLDSVLVPIAIKCLYDPMKKFASYKKRNLLHLNPDSELRVLVCIHKPDHISSMINVLGGTLPSKESRIACHVLHMVELRGQATPLMISHQMHGQAVEAWSYSNNVIASFEHFKQNFSPSVSVDIFTSISAPKHMHEDICWLGLDKTTSLIILPFHRTWTVDRSTVVFDDPTIRMLNLDVLRRAPCSVGILIGRKKLLQLQNSASYYKVCVVFIGGRDDREALALGKRMSRNSNVNLTVLHFVPAKKLNWTNKYDEMLDKAELKNIVKNDDTEERENTDAVTCIEEIVEDGADTWKFLRAVACDYDLIVVGRSSGANAKFTKGIEEWCEFEELGFIGDFLASPDVPTRASILVIQQQQTAIQ